MPRLLNRAALTLFVAICGTVFVAQATAQRRTDVGESEPLPMGSTRLNQTPSPQTLPPPATPPSVVQPAVLPLAAEPPAAMPYVLGEFERYVQRQARVEVRRLGADLVSGGYDGRAGELSPLVPADYILAPGDEVLVNLWGSVDADLKLTVDRTGSVVIPRVGSVQVAGVRYADLEDLIARRVGQQFRNFKLNVSLGQLRGIRVFVTGRVVRPGAYTVTSLSTVVSALMRAGGPSAAGSFRNINLWRGGKLVVSYDLYDLLLKGDRSADRIVQAGDVVNVASVGPQIAVIGSVNNPAVIEIKPGETVADMLRFAGGFTAVADRTRLAVERLLDRNAGRVMQLEMPRDETQTLSQGDLIYAFSGVDVELPTQPQSKRIKIEGEVGRPSEYVLPVGSTVADAIRAAGGFTSAAYLFGTEFTRLSVQLKQQENYERALRDLETELAKSVSSQRIATQDEAATQTARAASATRLLERLRALKPTGRIVLQLDVGAAALPDLALEDGDRIYIPPRPTTVGVFGSVFNAATYLYSDARSLADYLRLAGGATKGADEESMFVVRLNGNVVSSRQSSGWFNRTGDFGNLPAAPGDTIFVPEEVDKTTFTQLAKDWTQILFQFGLGAAGIKNALR